MWTKAITLLCLAACYQVSAYPYANQFGDYGDYVGQRGLISQYARQTRPGGPITGLISNALNTVGQFVGDLGGAIGRVLGGSLGGLGQFGQDVQDFLQPIAVDPWAGTNVVYVADPNARPPPPQQPAPPLAIPYTG